MRKRRLAVACRVIASVLATLVPMAWPRRADAAATIVVNTAAFEDVTNSECSIYEAIIAANTNADYKGCVATNAGFYDSIVFDLTPGNRRISNLGNPPLPTITEPVTIDGGELRVELHGSGGAPVSGRHGLIVGPTGAGTIIRNLVINNFPDDGIFINADEVWVFGCRIGTDVTGMLAMPNQGFGIQVFGGNGVRIGGATTGGACAGDCNVISAANSNKAGILLDLNSLNALVRGNFIGTDVTGSAGIAPSNGQGIVDKGRGNRIGGTANTTPGGPCTGDCNLISGNNINGGIVLDQAAMGALVQGNFIGTDVSGTASISNGVSEGYSEGILSYANYATIGGTTPAARNVVSGNVGTGVQVRGIGTVVRGNYLGTNAAGTAAVPNSGPGVTLYQADSAIIGGLEPGAGNLISGSSNNGASGVQALQASNAQIIGNLIGTAADGISPLPNLAHGVNLYEQSTNNFVGGASDAAGNVIAFNGQVGVRVDANAPQVRSNTIRSNRIHDNGDAGIALIAGANDDLAPPTIDAIGPLHGTSCADCIVEIFSDRGAQGAVFEGTVYSGDGTWSFDGALSGPHVTATNTDHSNNTSPFSAPFVLFSPTPTASPTPPIPTVTATPPATPSRTATASAAPSPSAAATATLTAASTPSAPVACTGDCDGDGEVTINELITGVSIALGALPDSACPAFENDAGMVDIAQLVRGVANALNGCALPV
ncbi:MAG: right-handed parallel beta-helix repeat-containing protein [bacterium]